MVLYIINDCNYFTLKLKEITLADLNVRMYTHQFIKLKKKL